MKTPSSPALSRFATAVKACAIACSLAFPGFVGATTSASQVRGFQKARSTPSERLRDAGPAREMHAVVELLREATEALDRGDIDKGVKHARMAARQLEALEAKEIEQGRSVSASKMAEQRARVHQEMLGDLASAKEALADAVAADGGNMEAARALEKLLDHEAAAQGRANN